MKFSVLLPTRNRLELLRLAVETVRRQDCGDWEIVVSDNCSEQDVEGYVRSLGDPRIRYFRTTRFLPVTENWNHALAKSTGDYVLMLGDDDCLLKGYFSTVRSLIGAFEEPDLIYTRALLYAYPGVMPGHPDGFLFKAGCASFFENAREPFLLGPDEPRKLVHDSMNLRLSFDFNMQYSLIRKGLIDSLSRKGRFFQSPYPDFYATNVCFLKSKKILIVPRYLVAIGISPKSFGYFYFNKRENQGVDFLKNVDSQSEDLRLRPLLLPGTDMNTSWLFAMERIRANYGEEFALNVNYRRYRRLQILHVLKEFFIYDNVSTRTLRDLWSRLHALERILFGSTFLLLFPFKPFLRTIKDRRWFHSMVGLPGNHGKVDHRISRRRFKDILEVFEKADPDNGDF